jgi:Zn-dependent protease
MKAPFEGAFIVLAECDIWHRYPCPFVIDPHRQRRMLKGAGNGGDMGSSFRLGRILGVEIGVHWSWIFIFLIVTWSFATGVFEYYYDEWSGAQRWTGAVVVSVVFFLSVLIHEMSHAVVSNRLGLPVRSITLFIFGGAANLSKEPEKASDELKIAIVGPASSLALGGVFALVVLALLPVDRNLAGIASYLALINVSLAIFNMLPGYPLDGGRVFRAVVWSRNGDRLRATRTAARLGEWIAYGIMALGVLQVFVAGLVSGLWLLLIGFFLRNISSASYEQLLIETTLSGIRVDEVMRKDIPSVAPDMTLDELVHDQILRGNARAFAVVAASDLAGLITLSDVRKVPREEWATTSVYRAMSPASALRTVEPGQCLTDVLQTMVAHDVNQLPVVRGRGIVGMLDRGDVMRYIEVRRELGEAAAERDLSERQSEAKAGRAGETSPRAS